MEEGLGPIRANADVSVEMTSVNPNPTKDIPVIDILEEDSVEYPSPSSLSVTDASGMFRVPRPKPRRPSNISKDGNTDSCTHKNKHVAWKRLDVNLNTAAPRPREGHRALVHGHLMITFSGAIGLDGRSYGDLHTFNIITKAWSSPKVGGNKPPGLMNYGMDIYGDQIILFGGLKDCGTLSSDLYELDTLTWEWSKLEPNLPPVVYETDVPPCARVGHSFTTVDGKIYLFGGMSDKSMSRSLINPATLQDLYELEYVEKQGWYWNIPPINGTPPKARKDHSAVAYQDPSSESSKLIIFGGLAPDAIRLQDLVILDIASATWFYPTLSGIPPRVRSSHSATLFGTRMFVFGGWTEPPDLLTPVPELSEDEKSKRRTRGLVSSDLYCLDLKEWAWKKLGSDENGREIGTWACWPQPRACHSAARGQSMMYIWSGLSGYKDAENRVVCHSDLYQLEVERPMQIPGKVVVTRSKISRMDTTSVLASWKAVEGADSYILQICECQSDSDTQVIGREVEVPISKSVPSSIPIPFIPPQPPYYYSSTSTPYYPCRYRHPIRPEMMAPSNGAAYHMIRTPIGMMGMGPLPYPTTEEWSFAQQRQQPMYQAPPRVPAHSYPGPCSLPSQFQQPLPRHPTLSMEFQDSQGGLQPIQQQLVNSGVFNMNGGIGHRFHSPPSIPGQVEYYGGRGQGKALHRITRPQRAVPRIVPQQPLRPARRREPQAGDLSVLSQLADIASRIPSVGPVPPTSQDQPPTPPVF